MVVVNTIGKSRADVALETAARQGQLSKEAKTGAIKTHILKYK
jgi:hypothetical protein